MKCGISWNGFNLEGDSKSVDEVKRLIHQEGRLVAIEAQRNEYKAMYESLREINKRQEQQLTDYSWRLNPDRMGR